MSSLDMRPQPLPLSAPARLLRALPWRRLAAGGLALGSMLVIWHGMALQFRPWVPDIDVTFAAIQRQLGSVAFWDSFWLTFGRVLSAFASATVVGGALGLLIGLSPRAESFFQPLLALALAVPDPVYIIFAILAMGTGEAAGFVALTLAVMPFVANIVRANVHARDTALDEMAQIYHLPRPVRMMAVLFPQLVPALLTAMRFSFALSWKLVVVVEAIGQPDGIGAAIFHAFRQLRMREVAAIAIIFILAMQLVERGLLGRLEKRLLRWRA